MLDQPEPDVSRAFLRTTNAVRRTKWEIEAGVVGSWSKLPTRKSPAFVAQYDGFPDILLHRQREAIARELRKMGSAKSRCLMRLMPPEVPQSVGEESSPWSNSHRLDIEEMLRSADFDARDLDEADMNGVVSAVMSAAAEAARLANARF